MQVRFLALLLLAFVPADAQPDDARWRALLQKDAAGDPEPRAREALKIAERFGEADPRLLESLIFLHENLWGFESKPEKEALRKRALALPSGVARRVAGDRAAEADFASLLLRLGKALSGNGQHRDARLTQREALEIRERLFGESSASTAEAWVALAWTAQHDKSPDEARGAISRALELRKQSGAGRTPEFAGLLEESARLFGDDKKFAECEAEYRRSLALRESLSGPHDPELAKALTRIARDVRHWKSPQFAESCFRRAVEVRKAAAAGAPAHRDALNDLADFLAGEERTGEAEQTYEMAVALRRDRAPVDHVAIASLRGLVSLRMEADRYADAIEAGEPALAAIAADRDLAPFDLTTLRRDLAECYLRTGNDARAEAEFAVLRADAQGVHRHFLAETANRLSKIYQERGDYPKAAEKLEIAIAAWEALGYKNPEDMLRLAKLYQAMGRLDDANRMNMAALAATGGMVTSELRGALRIAAIGAGLALFFGVLVSGLLFWVLGRRLDREIAALFAPPPTALAALPVNQQVELAPVRFLVPEDTAPAPVEEQSPAPPAEVPPEPPPPTRMTVHADGTTLFAMRVLNLLLALLTLGVYSFWGKAKVRRYVLGQIEYLGDRFAFHGHGRELFFGWLRALPALGFVFLFPNILPLAWQSQYSMLVAQLAVFALIFLLWPIARVGAYRYRITRMSWRGIRFSYRGSALRYLRVTLAGQLLNGLTGGLYNPFLEMRRERLLTGDTWFGTARFQFTGKGSDLFAAWLFALPFTFCTLGLAWP